jgi:hypothetical protein
MIANRKKPKLAQTNPSGGETLSHQKALKN